MVRGRRAAVAVAQDVLGHALGGACVDLLSGLPGLFAEMVGKALAVHDKTQHVDRGGIWYPTVPAHGHTDAVIVFVEVAS